MERRTHDHAPDADWSRRKLLALLSGMLVALLALVVGLGLSVYYTVFADDASSSGSRLSPRGEVDPRTELAELPMAEVDGSASRPGPLTTKPFEVIKLPSPTNLGPAGVSSGFPRTREGALAQLVAIDQATLQSASVAGAQAVITGWAVPAGPTAETWSGVRAVAQLLGAAGLTGSGSSSLTVSASPEMGLIKGSVGEDFVVACVDFVVTASMTQSARVAAADCQRMEWVDDRWMIGEGPEPAQPPSVWPGTNEASRVGYKVLRDD